MGKSKKSKKDKKEKHEHKKDHHRRKRSRSPSSSSSSSGSSSRSRSRSRSRSPAGRLDPAMEAAREDHRKRLKAEEKARKIAKSMRAQKPVLPAAAR